MYFIFFIIFIRKKGRWCEYCKREERIQNFISHRNGAPYGTFLDPPEVDAHKSCEENSFFVFKNDSLKEGAKNR